MMFRSQDRQAATQLAAVKATIEAFEGPGVQALLERVLQHLGWPAFVLTTYVRGVRSGPRHSNAPPTVDLLALEAIAADLETAAVSDRKTIWTLRLPDSSNVSGRLQSAAAVPVLQAEKIIGSLVVFSETPQENSPSASDLLFLIAHQALILVKTESLQRDRKRMEQVASMTEDTIITADETSRIVYVNVAVTAMFGYAPEELLGRSLTVLMPAEMRQLHQLGQERHLLTGKRHIDWNGTRLPALHKNGETFMISLRLSQFFEGGHTYFTGLMRRDPDRSGAAADLQDVNP